MKNHHELTANAKNQRAVLPSLLGAVAGESSPFQGSKMTVLWVLEHVGGAPRPPYPSPGSGAACVDAQGWARKVKGWDVCERPGVCVHGFWQEVVEVT